MSDTKTTPVKTGGKLPEYLFYLNKGQPAKKETADIISTIVTMFGVRQDGDKAPEAQVKTILLLSLRSLPNEPEIPEGFEDLASLKNSKGASLSDWIHGFAAKHLELKKQEEETKNTEKEKAAELREAAKAAKAEEDKKFQESADEFTELLSAQLVKASKNTAKTTEALTTFKLPTKISFTSGGMGVAVASGATEADIATAAATVLAQYEGIKNAEGALQFMMGDLVNASVESGVYRTQNDAAQGLKFIIQDKCQKSYELGTIQQYAMMAGRIPSEQRKLGIKPSLYLAAAKVTPPRLKDARPADTEAANEEVQKFRNELIDDINTGDLKIKDVTAKVEAFKTEKAWIKPAASDKAEENKQLNRLFMAMFLATRLSNKDDKVTVARGKDSHEYTVAELVEIQEEAIAYLTSTLVGGSWDIAALVKGTKNVEKNGKSKLIPYLISDPFFVKPASVTVTTVEPEPEPVVEEQEDEEEVDIETEEDEDDDGI